MQIATGTLDGTGAALHVGIGFKPRMVKIWNVTETALPLSYAKWMSEFWGLAARAGGTTMAFLDDTDGDALSYTAALGIAQYDGGVVGDNTEVYLIKDPNPDKRALGSTSTEISAYTQDSGTAGHFNAPFSVTAPNIVGVGSILYIDSGSGAKEYYISAYSNDGDAASDLTLNAASKSGTVTYLGGRFTYVQCPTTLIMPPGFTVNFTTGVINTNSEMMAFIAYGR